MMEHPRYEIGEEIGKGSFATVYRGVDVALKREIAIKQLDECYLGRDDELQGYWQEAQLLASMQHPNIMTIYDLDPCRGWLILQLMEGSVQDGANGRSLHYNYVYVLLINCLRALGFMHARGLIHGDIKPSNMLIDARKRICLSDFGLARSTASDDGSVLRGTAKYMAPEIVSDQFGPVGANSDLYSLGISAYELLCGDHFESLIPGLMAFAENKQMAWMTWHAAPDRRLPKVAEILPDIPEHLGQVIDRLVNKNPQQRYQSADEVLEDLKVASEVVSRAEKALKEKEVADTRRRVRRNVIVAVVATAISLVTSLMLLRPIPSPRPQTIVEDMFFGTVRNVLVDERILILQTGADNTPREVSIGVTDRIFINEQLCLLRDLALGDEVHVRKRPDEQGRPIFELKASRPQSVTGIVLDVQPKRHTLTVRSAARGGASKELELFVPASLSFELNSQKDISGRPVALADLAIGDRVVLTYAMADNRLTVFGLRALRELSLQGTLQRIDIERRRLFVEAMQDGDNQVLQYHLGCEVRLNGESQSVAGGPLSITDLMPGDIVHLVYCSEITQIDAKRTMRLNGKVHIVSTDLRSLQIIGHEGQISEVGLTDACQLTLGSQPAVLADIRKDDRVAVVFEERSGQLPSATSIVANRPVDWKNWIIVIDVGHAETAASEETMGSDTVLGLHSRLTSRCRVPKEQAILLGRNSLFRLRSQLSLCLEQLAPESQLTVICRGSVRFGDDNAIVLVKQAHDLTAGETRPFTLQELLTNIDIVTAREKIVLLDFIAPTADDRPVRTSGVSGDDANHLESGLPPLASTSVIVHARGGPSKDTPPDAFLERLIEALAGDADRDLDGWLKALELTSFLEDQVTVNADIGGSSLKLHLPSKVPDRLSPEAVSAIQAMLAHVADQQVDVLLASRQFHRAQQAAPNEIEPSLAYGLLQLKGGQLENALSRFEDVMIRESTNRVAREGAIWILAHQKRGRDVIRELIDLAVLYSAASGTADESPQSTSAFAHRSGMLREYVAHCLSDADRPTAPQLAALDQQFLEMKFQSFYRQGRTVVRTIADDLDKEIEAGTSRFSRAQAMIKRRSISTYGSFPFDKVARDFSEHRLHK